MAHEAQKQYCTSVKQKFPHMFENVSVLDVGSMDINGNNRYLFENYTYTGLDIGPGRNVDVVSSGHLYRSEQLFDVVISTECFEHDKFWSSTIYNTWFHLKPGGLYLFTCATDGRHEHGTTRTDGWASPYTNDYYLNLNEALMRKGLPIEKMFSNFEFSVNKQAFDLYFYGIKHAGK